MGFLNTEHIGKYFVIKIYYYYYYYYYSTSFYIPLAGLKYIRFLN
jgi:hypothetical protein